jgi:Golgi SNAP receptor complex protein 1
MGSTLSPSSFSSQLSFTFRLDLNSCSSLTCASLDTLPGMNTLLGLIQSKRRRDTIILGCVIGTLTVLFLTYVVG